MQSIIMLRVRYVHHFSSHAFYLYFGAYLLVMLNFVLLSSAMLLIYLHTHVLLTRTWSQNERRRRNHQINCTLWFVSQIMFCFYSILHLFCYCTHSIWDSILLLVKFYHLFQSFQLKIKRFWFKSPVHLLCLVKFIKFSLYIKHNLAKSYQTHVLSYTRRYKKKCILSGESFSNSNAYDVQYMIYVCNKSQQYLWSLIVNLFDWLLHILSISLFFSFFFIDIIDPKAL